MLGTTLIVHRIGPSPTQVSDGLVGGFRDVDGFEISSAVAPGQLLIRSLPLVSPLRGCLRQSPPGSPEPQWSASRRSVLILSPDCRGIFDGATMMHSWPSCWRRRARTNQQGPALTATAALRAARVQSVSPRSAVAEVEFNFQAVLLAYSGNGFFYCRNAIADISPTAEFAVSTGFGDGNCDGVFVDIKSDIEYVFHWCVCQFA